MKIINGENAILGRLASHVAKTALLGDEIAIINCDKIIITGGQKSIQRDFKEKRSRFGHSQKGPKHPSTSEKIVKRTIRGMLPNYREGRGRVAWKRIKCYVGIPKEFEDKEFIVVAKEKRNKFSKVKDFARELK